LLKEFLTPVNSNRTRVDTSMSGQSFATTPTQDIIVYQLIAGGKYDYRHFI
jgi:hypothetical protein